MEQSRLKILETGNPLQSYPVLLQFYCITDLLQVSCYIIVYIHKIVYIYIYMCVCVGGGVRWSEFKATDPEVRDQFPALQVFLRSSGYVTGSNQPREYN
jgi:hypothetical protein